MPPQVYLGDPPPQTSFDSNYQEMEKIMASKRRRPAPEPIPAEPHPTAPPVQPREAPQPAPAEPQPTSPTITPVVNTEAAGGSRFSQGKPRMWLLPWGGLKEVGRVAETGGVKYAPLDYLEGQSFSTLMDCAMRHQIAAMRDPLARDPESGHLHAAHAAWNLLALLDAVDRGEAERLDDITPWRGITAMDGERWAGSGSKPAEHL